MGKVSGRPKTRIGILIPGTGEKAQACDEPKSSPDLPERPATAVALRRRAIISVFSRLSPILGRFHSRASTKNLPLRIARCESHPSLLTRSQAMRERDLRRCHVGDLRRARHRHLATRPGSGARQSPASKAASMDVSSRVICIPRKRNPPSRGSESSSTDSAEGISSCRSFIEVPSCHMSGSGGNHVRYSTCPACPHHTGASGCLIGKRASFITSPTSGHRWW